MPQDRAASRGARDSEHAVLSAAHVSHAVSDRFTGTVLLRRDVDDPVGSAIDLRVRCSIFAFTGIYFFYDSYIPIAVFLGMHLLFTDPSTSPRTELGRIIFGVLYGLSTVLLYQMLGSLGMPTFYDKLLQVPLLNLSIQGIDRIARSRFYGRLTRRYSANL